MRQVVQLFSNPRSGTYTPKRIRALIKAFESRGARVLHCESSSSAPVIRADVSHVCVAAGDGTVRHVAGAVARSGHPVALSIFPAGTVNLLALEAGYAAHPDTFARTVLDSKPRRRHYPVAMGQGFFFACAGVGPDSFAVARVSDRLKRRFGRVAYAVAFCGALRDWRRPRIELDIGGCTTECEAFYVAKGRYYAGSWSFAHGARLDEPVLHVVALTTVRRRDYARFVWALIRRKDPAALRNVQVFTCAALTARSAEALPIQADGDIVAALPVTLAVSEAPLIFC
jgi:diacylglycerol kinase family enzyme